MWGGAGEPPPGASGPARCRGRSGRGEVVAAAEQTRQVGVGGRPGWCSRCALWVHTPRRTNTSSRQRADRQRLVLRGRRRMPGDRTQELVIELGRYAGNLKDFSSTRATPRPTTQRRCRAGSGRLVATPIPAARAPPLPAARPRYRPRPGRNQAAEHRRTNALPPAVLHGPRLGRRPLGRWHSS